MARILNIVSQLIYLAKQAKKQVEKGQYSSVARLFKKIVSLEKHELAYVKVESGSKELYRACLRIYKDTKKYASRDLRLNQKKVIQLLERIIALEQYELKRTIKSKGLTKEILKTIDPYIQELINEMNKLSFVKTTHFSCSGHFPRRVHSYVMVEYDWKPQTRRNIEMFHAQLLEIVKEAGMIKKSTSVKLSHRLF